MNVDNIKVTLESLYDILRNEKKREELQLLEDTFFIDVITYIRQKKAFLETKKDVDGLFSSGEKDKLEYEIRSIKRILKEIYEKREKKIIDIALNRSRTGSDIIDNSSMLTEEKIFYQKILKTLDLFRRGILLNLFNGEFPTLVPEYKENEEKKEVFKKFEGAPSMAADEETSVEENSEDSEGPTVEENSETENKDTEDAEETEESTEVESSSSTDSKKEIADAAKEEKKEVDSLKQDLVKIKIIKPMPSFVWKDMKVYGPFDVDEEVDIFPEVADLMVRKGRAEKV
jgi:DNA replication initiation complex subunit (GINS family)